MAKVVKPTPKENVEIQRRLRKKYPNMGTENWVSKLKKKVRKQVRAGDPAKKGKTLRTRKQIDSMRKSGMTEREIRILSGGG